MLKFNKHILSLIAASAILLSGCASNASTGGSTASYGAAASANDPDMNMVKNHAYSVDYPNTPLVDIINKYISSPQWAKSDENGVETITVSGQVKNVDKEMVISISVQDNPEDESTSLLDITYFRLGNYIIPGEDAWGGVLDLYDYYAKGADDLSELDRIYLSNYDGILLDGFEWVDVPTTYITDDGVIFLKGAIKNVSNASTYAAIKFDLYDANNNMLGVVSDETSELKSGDTWTFNAIFPTEYNDSFETWDIRFSTSKYDASDFEKITVQELYDELSNNALRAETMFQDKLLEVSGYICSTDSDGKYFTIASTPDSWDINTLMCDFADDTQRQVFMNMNKGDSITVRVKIKSIGEIIGYTADLIEIL